MKRIIVAALLLLPIAGTLHAQDFVYVNNNPAGPNSVSAFSVTGAGALVPVPGSPYFTGGAGDVNGYFATNRITTCVVGNVLYATNDGSSSVSGFLINPGTGTLSSIPGSPFSTGGFSGGLGISLGVTPDGRYLFAGNGASQNLTVFRIAANGALSQIPGSPFVLPAVPDGIKITPDGEYVIVTLPTIFPQAVAVLGISSNGVPVPVPGSPFATLGDNGPTSVDADCANRYAFVSEANGDRTIVDVFSRQPGGGLVHIPGAPFQFISGQNSNVAVLSGDDRYLFVSNQYTNSITVLSVGFGGGLALVPGSPFVDPGGDTPTLMATNRLGTLLYVGNANSTVSVLRVFGNGTLAPVPGSPFFTGGSPRCGVAAFPPKSCTEFCTPSNVPPTFTAPVCGSVVNALVGAPLRIFIRATDPDSGDAVGINATGLPPGSTLTAGNPDSARFDWTPLLSDQGDHVIMLFATDLCGHSDVCSLTVSVSTNRSPDCSQAVAVEPTLWPADHRYHAVQIQGVTDPDADPVTIAVTSITQDEPVNARGDGNTCPDAQIVGGQAAVRAERSGTPGLPGNGRVYAINFVANDGKSGFCGGTVYMCVPHDQSGPACVDDGQRYLSTGECRSRDTLLIESVTLRIAEVTSYQARFTFALPKDSHVDLSVFDVAGRRIATITNEQLASGTYERNWNMAGIPNGVFFVRIRAGGATLTKTVFKAQ